MKKKKYLLLLFLFLIPTQTYATSGRLKGSSIIQCNGNYYGQHGNGHWHIASKSGNYWYPNGGEIHSNPCNNNNNYIVDNTPKYVEPVIIKSSDTSLKEIKINNEAIDINDNMNYSTKESTVEINVTTNHSKANVNISNNYKNLEIGNNKIIITVTAENGDKLDYLLNIYKLNSNNKAIIKYNNNKIKFTKNKSDKITVKKNTKKITFDVLLEDSNAKSNAKKSYKLKKGNNKINITITAENGEKRKYIINVYRKKGLFS